MNRVHRFLVATWAIACVLSVALGAFASPATIDASTRHLQLGPYLEVFEDTTATLGIDDVVRPEVAAEFKPLDKPFPNYGFTKSAVWARFTVENASDAPIERWLVLDFPPIEHVQVFREGEAPATQGILHPPSLRELPRRSYSFRIALAPHERRVVHVRAWGYVELQMPLDLWELSALGDFDRKFASIGSFAIGVMAALGLYNAFLFFYVRERAYLYYALYVFFIGIWLMSLDGSLFELAPAWVVASPHTINIIGGYAGIAFAPLFVRRVLRPQEQHRYLDWALLTVVVASPVCAALYFLGVLTYRTQSEVGAVLGIGGVVVGVVLGIVRWREGVVAARYMVLAWSSLPLFAILSLLSILGTIPVQRGLLPYGLASESVLFSLALAADARQRNAKIAAQHRASVRFVPHELLALIGRRELLDVRQGDQIEREMTIFFLDVRSFTTLVEKMTPEQTIAFVNAVFAKMEAPIAKHRGVIDKFMGDGIMALFERADDAVAASVACLGALDAYNASAAQRIAVGIGLHTGPVMVGTVGGDERLSCTVIGDGVNLASRIEGMTKTFGASILMSGATRAALKADVETRKLGRVAAKGKALAVEIYEVLDGLPPDERARKIATRADLEAAVGAFAACDLAGARARFASCVEANADDRAAALYVDACAKVGGASREGWDGAVQLDVK
jgi:class 3 adenylate cyclase